MDHAKTITTFLSCLVAVSAAADSIELRRAIRMPLNRDEIRLSDVAILKGEAALQLGAVVILENPEPTILQTVRVEDVREVLDDHGVAWGMMNLSGGDVLIRPRPSSVSSRPAALQPDSIKKTAQVRSRDLTTDILFTAQSLEKETTVRGEIARRIALGLSLPVNRVRLHFQPQDEALLASTLDSAQLEIDPLSSWMTDRVELTLRLWKDGRVIDSHGVTVRPEILATFVELKNTVQRGSTISESDLLEKTEWVGPTEARQLAHRIAAIGRVATRSIRKGEILRSRDVKQESVISRGDPVNVRCLSGGVIISLQAEARSEASVGDEVELRKFGERDTFYATVSGPGEAVIQVSPK